MALSLGQISLVPGGLGVFEAVLLLLLPGSVPEGALVASLMAYRAIYYLLPLVLASVALALYERRRRRRALDEAADSFGRAVSTVVPLTLSALVFVAGAFMLVTGALPAPEGRMAWLGRALPLPVVELSHFLGSLVGALLLFLAWGLRQRLHTADPSESPDDAHHRAQLPADGKEDRQRGHQPRGLERRSSILSGSPATWCLRAPGVPADPGQPGDARGRSRARDPERVEGAVRSRATRTRA